MRFTTIFFDLDDTLYPSSTNLWLAIKGRMNEFMRDRMNIPVNEIPALREKYYLQYGTTMRGLQANHKIDVDDFLNGPFVQMVYGNRKSSERYKADLV